MNIYQYIASSNPAAAHQILTQFNFDASQAQTTDDLAECLQQLVSQNGAQALSAILDVHPDKEVILEMKAPATSSKDCGCKKSTKNTDAYIASAQQHASGAAHQASTFLWAGIILVTVVLLATSGKSKS